MRHGSCRSRASGADGGWGVGKGEMEREEDEEKGDDGSPEEEEPESDRRSTSEAGLATRISAVEWRREEAPRRNGNPSNWSCIWSSLCTRSSSCCAIACAISSLSTWFTSSS